MATAKRGRVGDALLITVFGACLVAAACLIGKQVLTDMAYRNLEGEVAMPVSVEADAAGGDWDWDGLFAQNPDTVAWLSVEGTPISYPVVQPGEGKQSDWYLKHDFWGNRSDEGCPYLDVRSPRDGRHLLVYGHHLGFSDRMFSPIFSCYRQSEFDKLGSASWFTPDGGRLSLSPVCSLSVDMSYEPIQTFRFDGEDGLREWLRGIAESATARAADWENSCAGAERVLTLVTCSSAWSGQRARTLVVFAA
ncbi:class B sortase [Gordonibacter pamelaeae]|uniref:class B sortase n=1 Tax=Gordonibacter pamelaeae TaxID=471189 RepID=UPI002108A238|nr:class B sortase [Gordonibacter pamelaeae]MCQ4848395.1 class B sortase [Gordonibacter pamelaeae]MCQ4850786.1 class B sortase [Gordonibacter pamelaeae]